MQTTCWTVSEYIFAQVMSSAIWFACTAIGGLVFYKLRHRIAGALRGVIQEATRKAAGVDPPLTVPCPPGCALEFPHTHGEDVK